MAWKKCYSTFSITSESAQRTWGSVVAVTAGYLSAPTCLIKPQIHTVVQPWKRPWWWAREPGQAFTIVFLAAVVRQQNLNWDFSCPQLWTAHVRGSRVEGWAAKRGWGWTAVSLLHRMRANGKTGFSEMEEEPRGALNSSKRTLLARKRS